MHTSASSTLPSSCTYTNRFRIEVALRFKSMSPASFAIAKNSLLSDRGAASDHAAASPMVAGHAGSATGLRFNVSMFSVPLTASD
jgi:hypothetical protein